MPVGRAPVSEYDEMQELEAARERNDLDISDLRAMSVTELRSVGRDLEIETAAQERREELVDRILQRQSERAGYVYATGILDIVDKNPSPHQHHVSEIYSVIPNAHDAYTYKRHDTVLHLAHS